MVSCPKGAWRGVARSRECGPCCCAHPIPPTRPSACESGSQSVCLSVCLPAAGNFYASTEIATNLEGRHCIRWPASAAHGSAINGDTRSDNRTHKHTLSIYLISLSHTPQRRSLGRSMSSRTKLTKLRPPTHSTLPSVRTRAPEPEGLLSSGGEGVAGRPLYTARIEPRGRP